MNARAIALHASAEVELAFMRMGLPTPAREFLLEKLPAMQVLLTDVADVEARFLKQCERGQEAPGREEFPAFIAGDLARRPGTALLSGRRDQFARLIQAAGDELGLTSLRAALSALLQSSSERAFFSVGGRRLGLGKRTYLMGVVNVTPDSFSDGGRYVTADAAISHGKKLVDAGADFLDIGGESTRPGAVKVDVKEELGRILPAIRGLKDTGALISVDTAKSEVARAALDAGACMVNDISGFSFDEAMARVVGKAQAACCLMHIQGTPETMQQKPQYGDVVAEVMAFLSGAADRAVAAGVARDAICIDVGIGFGKTLGHNLFLLRRLSDFRLLGFPILLGTSRKSFLGALTSGKPPADRLAATLGSLAAVSAAGSADILRVHDVAEAKDAVAVADAIRQASDGGTLYSVSQR